MAYRKPLTIVLLGNYALDRQESMLRFHDLLAEQLTSRNIDRQSISPSIFLGGFFPKSRINKWLAYLDKYVLFPLVLRQKLGRLKKTNDRMIVHICDHSNAVYANVARRHAPVLVTCHDLLAVRGALGEDTDCPASGLGKILQRAILRGLQKATHIVCVSSATRTDLIRLGGKELETRSRVIPLSLSHPYRPIPATEVLQCFKGARLDLEPFGYILHVGSSLRRKNREALIKAVAELKDSWKGKIVFSGLPLDVTHWELARSLDLQQRIVEVKNPTNDLLMALYNGAQALVFMSRFEGFGWPVLEAQACGCPVICSNRTSVPEVAGEGALAGDPEDHAFVASSILRLQEPTFRQTLIEKGLENARKFTTERMMQAYETVYDRLAPGE